MIGKTILHYKIIEELGRGGMGVVYKAEDTKLKRYVALKFLPPELTRDEEAKKRLVIEAQAASSLDHPNICTVHEINETTDKQMYLVMTCYEGETLQEKIDKSPLPVKETLVIAQQIVSGLSKAHKKEIIHRDLKPANIFITNDGLVKILDFGLAKLSGGTKLTQEGTTLGTANYMSPEQVRGDTSDNRTDIWALGMILFEMITGQSPFKGEREEAVFYSILNEEQEPITGLRSGVPMELERIVNKSLEKNPDERYQHMEDILVDLKSLEKGIESGKSLTKTITAVTPKKNRAIIYGGMALVVVLLILVGFLLTPNSTAPIDSIAVLPLENLSGDPEQDYFADGMTEAIITELSKIKALRVISRTSVMHYKKTEKTLPEIAKELNVKAVVEGSVLSAGEKVRITAQLINLAPERHLWTNNYDRDLRDILTLSSEVAQAIAKEIKITLTPQEQARMAITRPVNPEAHQLFLKGRYQLYKSTTKDVIDKSIEYFQQSLEKDSTYPFAHVGLAEAYIQLAETGYAPVKTAIPKSKSAALKALAIDSSLGEAYTQLASAKVFGEWDWLGGEKLYKKAIELNPGSAIAHLNYGFLLTYLGRHEEAIREGKIAQQLDPLSIWINGSVGRFYYYARQYDQTIVECNKVLELNPGAIFPQFLLAFAYVQKGKYEQAIAEFLQRNVRSPGTNWALGYTYGVAGYKEEATEILNFLLEKSKNTFIWPAIIAYVYIGLGDKDKALEWLEKTYEQQEVWLEVLKVDPWFDSLRNDSRFHDLVKRMNFPEYVP